MIVAKKKDSGEKLAAKVIEKAKLKEESLEEVGMLVWKRERKRERG